MKNKIKNIVKIIVIALITFSFTTVNAQTKQIKTEESNLVWKGYKVTGSHQGIIAIKSGSLTFINDKLTGGTFTTDMTTLMTTDDLGDYKAKLEGHLKSDDFFGVKTHPTATLVFTNIKSTGKNSYLVTGNMTIKDKTNEVKFNISVYGNKATVSLKIDRTKYGVRYGSASFFNNLKDKTIYDDFDLVADLEF